MEPIVSGHWGDNKSDKEKSYKYKHKCRSDQFRIKSIIFSLVIFISVLPRLTEKASYALSCVCARLLSTGRQTSARLGREGCKLQAIVLP